MFSYYDSDADIAWFPTGESDDVVSERVPGGLRCYDRATHQRWLIRHALASQRGDLARTYLALEGKQVMGYVSLTTGSVRHDEAPKRYARRMPAYPIPTILIARLAVDKRHQGRQLGSRLLAEALRLAVVASDAAAARLVVVDAIDEHAAAFYRKRSFIDVPENALRPYRKVSDIRRTLKKADALASEPSTDWQNAE